MCCLCEKHRVDVVLEGIPSGWSAAVNRPEVVLLFDLLQEVVGFPLDDEARIDIMQVILVYQFHPTGGVPYIDYRRLIRAYIRRASTMPASRDSALGLAGECGLWKEISPELNENDEPLPSRRMAALYQLPIEEPTNLSAIRRLIVILDGVKDVQEMMTPELLDQVRSGNPPIEYSLKLGTFRNDVAAAKENVLEQFPTLQRLFDEVLNEILLRDALKGILRAREAKKDALIPRRGARRSRRRLPNMKSRSVQLGLRDALRNAARRSGTTLKEEDHALFLECMNRLSPRGWNFGTVQSARDAARMR